MARIRARLSHRMIFLLVGLGCLAVLIQVRREEERAPWKDFQARYRDRGRELLDGRIQEAGRKGDTAALERWKRVAAGMDEGTGFRIEQTFLPDAGVRDLCRTCHLGVENPLFREEPNPLRAHPAGILRAHRPDRFGCTPCHGGQGVGLSPVKAHGLEENWPRPRVPLRYVQGLCLGCHESPFRLKGAEKAEKGRLLFRDHGCYGCHEARSVRDLPRMSTPFEGIGTKIYKPEWIYAWIEDPEAMRPGTRMPTFRLSDVQRAHIVAYLVGRRKLPVRLAPYRWKEASYRRGKALFTEKGCIGCHSDRRKTPCLTDRVPNLGDAGLKLYSRWIVTWLRNPAALAPETAMPRLMLSDEERRDLTRYLKGLRPKAEKDRVGKVPGEVLAKGDPGEGRRLVQLMGCYGCHHVREMERLPLPGVAVAEMADKRLDELPFGNARVPRTKWDWLFHKIKDPALYETEDMPLKMPDYRLGDDEVEALTVYYLHNRYDDLPEGYLCRSGPEEKTLERGAWMVDHFNCRGCHQLEEGKKSRLDRYMALKSMVPPRLINEAERVQPQWFFQFLSRPVVLRPWLKLQMPDFPISYEQRRDLVTYFRLSLAPGIRRKVRVPYVRLPVREDYDPEVIEMGEYRVRTDKCMQCHPVSLDNELPEGIKLEDLSINLMLAKGRLRFEWIKDFLRNPDRYAGRGTKMPFVFYTPDGIARMPDPEMWIEYTALYLMFMEKVPEPVEEKKVEQIRPGAEIDWTQVE